MVSLGGGVTFLVTLVFYFILCWCTYIYFTGWPALIIGDKVYLWIYSGWSGRVQERRGPRLWARLLWGERGWVNWLGGMNCVNLLCKYTFPMGFNIFFLKINYKILRLLATTFSCSKKQNDICFIFSHNRKYLMHIFIPALFAEWWGGGRWRWGGSWRGRGGQSIQDQALVEG